MFRGWPPTAGQLAVRDEVHRVGGPRVLGVRARCRSPARASAGSTGTFSSTQPKRMAFQICGSPAADSRIVLA